MISRRCILIDEEAECDDDCWLSLAAGVVGSGSKTEVVRRAVMQNESGVTRRCKALNQLLVSFSP